MKLKIIASDRPVLDATEYLREYTVVNGNRPWGHYQVLANEQDHKVKRVTINPQKQLSLQKHYSRDEHWFVLEGTAIVTKGRDIVIVPQGKFVDIPRGVIHQLSNMGDTDLIFFEVQTGTGFGEKDIVRLDKNFDVDMSWMLDHAGEVKPLNLLESDRTPDMATDEQLKEYQLQVGERPWGKYFVLENAEYHKSKRIEVFPGKRLSLQRHQYRQEHWYITKGVAKVTLNEQTLYLKAGESVDILQGDIHRVENPGQEPMEFIEFQTGTYFGEDDIERLEDDHGRT